MFTVNIVVASAGVAVIIGICVALYYYCEEGWW